MGKISDGLKKYFEETPKEIIEKDWEEIKHLNEIGPDVIEYAELLKLKESITFNYNRIIDGELYDLVIIVDKEKFKK